MAARIRRGDRVVVIAGANKGQRGEVTRVIPKEDRAVVQGVNQVTKHVKPQGMGKPGGLTRVEAPIHLSNLMLIDPKSDRPTRVGFRVLEDGSKARFAKATGQIIDQVRRPR